MPALVHAGRSDSRDCAGPVRWLRVTARHVGPLVAVAESVRTRSARRWRGAARREAKVRAASAPARASSESELGAFGDSTHPAQQRRDRSPVIPSRSSSVGRGSRALPRRCGIGCSPSGTGSTAGSLRPSCRSRRSARSVGAGEFTDPRVPLDDDEAALLTRICAGCLADVEPVARAASRAGLSRWTTSSHEGGIGSRALAGCFRTLWATPEPLRGVAGVVHGVRDHSTPDALTGRAWLLRMERSRASDRWPLDDVSTIMSPLWTLPLPRFSEQDWAQAPQL